MQDAQSSEDREMLARMAANTENPKSSDNEAAIEKYLRSVLAVENILTLDRLRQVDYSVLKAHQLDLITFHSRSVMAILNAAGCVGMVLCFQEVAVKEHLAGKGKGSRRSLSSPSVHRVSTLVLIARTVRVKTSRRSFIVMCIFFFFSFLPQ